MSTFKPIPDDATIEAWLAGELTGGQARAVERFFEEHPPDGEVIAPELLRDLGNLREQPPEIGDLVERVRNRGGIVPSSGNAWREILTPSGEPDVLGTLGHYEVLEVIAEGGMGIVLKARDPELGRLAALKVLSPDLATNKTARERFLREARAAAALEHDNILPIYGIHGEPVPWFAMRHVSGGSLQDALDRGDPIPVARLKEIALKVASALKIAHAAGIVHRDIKPANILLEGDGKQVWVCDFGIARSTEDPALTYAGSVAGTPQYMSPEQADGGALDGRSDLFSLGAVLCRCATGKPAFHGATTSAVLRNVAAANSPGFTQLCRYLPRWFAGILSSLLEKDPHDRFADADALIEALKAERDPRSAVRYRRWCFLGLVSAVPAFLALGLLLRMPFLLEPVNHLLGSRHAVVYTIEGRLGAHGSLADAVAAARDGDAIVLPAGGELAVDGITLPADKALTLRSADQAARARFMMGETGSQGLVARAPLRLIGIDFGWKGGGIQEALVTVEDASVTLEDCRFSGIGPDGMRSDETTAHALALRGAAFAEIVRCDFDLTAANAVYLADREKEDAGELPPMAVAFRNSKVSAHWLVVSAGGKSRVARPVAVGIFDSEIRCETVLVVRDHRTFPSVACEASGTTFAAGKAFAWLGTQDAEIASERFTWAGKDTEHRLENDVVWIGERPEFAEAAALRPLASFADEPGAHEQAGASIGRIVIAETGETYFDFRTACEAAPDGATFLLSGYLFCREEVLAPLGMSLHLRAAPGASPVVIAAKSDAHALFLQGPATVEGIRFVRNDCVYGTLPILGIKPNGGTAEVRNCVFETTPLRPRRRNKEVFEYATGHGLSLTDFGSATVQGCTFRNGRGTGLYIGFVNEVTYQAELDIAECLFVGSNGIDRFSRQPETRLAVRMEGCTALCDYFYVDNLPQHHSETDLAVKNCLIDARCSLLTFLNTDMADLRSTLAWAGEGNAYREGMFALLRLSSGQRNGKATEESYAFAEFQNEVEKVTDDRATFGVPFDRTRLRTPVTAADLALAFNGARDTKAFEALLPQEETRPR